MLNLTRFEGESIVIGDDIEIFVSEIRGGKVMLSIAAPKEIPVHRREIYDLIKRKKPKEMCKQKQNDAQPAEKEATLMVTVRMPSSLHSRLKESLTGRRLRLDKRKRVSTNAFCVNAIANAIIDETNAQADQDS